MLVAGTLGLGLAIAVGTPTRSLLLLVLGVGGVAYLLVRSDRALPFARARAEADERDRRGEG